MWIAGLVIYFTAVVLLLLGMTLHEGFGHRHRPHHR